MYFDLPDTLCETEAQILVNENRAALCDRCDDVPGRTMFRQKRAELELHRRRLRHKLGYGLTQNSGGGPKFGEPIGACSRGPGMRAG